MKASVIQAIECEKADLGSNPGRFVVSNSNQKLSFTKQIIQAYDREILIVITVTVSSLVGSDK